MKKIEAIIKPFKLEDVKDALADIGVEGLTVTEVKGYGRQRGQTAGQGAGKLRAAFVPKTKIEVVLTDAQFASALRTIVAAVQTGKIGDGKIFVLSVERAIRIRTGEAGEAAF